MSAPSFFVAFLLAFFLCAVQCSAGESSKQSKVVEDFSDGVPGEFPVSFHTYPFQRHKALKVYTVQEEGGNRYLNANVSGETQDIAVQVLRKFDWDLNRFPVVSWRWRAKSLPATPPGSDRHFNDHACGVYVVFGHYGGKALKYVWSTDQPAGTMTEEMPDRFYVLVKNGGGKDAGQWQTVALNVLKDYQRAFHAEPQENPTGIALLTDGDGTHRPSVCDYDDFRISTP